MSDTFPQSPYVGRSDLELVFGVTNIVRWADLDGDGDETKISARINFAIQSASDYLDTILRGHNYTAIDIDRNIRRLASMIAALHLYDGREIIDGDPTADKMSVIRSQVDDMIGKIRRGEIQLHGARTKSAPEVVQDNENQKKWCLQRPFFCTQDNPFYGRFHP